MTPTRPENALNTLTFDNRFVRELPGDPEPANFRRQVTRACYSRVLPTPAAAPDPGNPLDAGGVCPRGDEHRQHVHSAAGSHEKSL
jgi:hypothetical protein